MLYQMLMAVTRVVARTLLSLLGGLRVEGRRNVPRIGPLIIAPNHPSNVDPVVLGTALRRNAWWIAKNELFSIRGLGAVIRAYRGIPIKRGAADRTAIRRAEKVLAQGSVLVMFPEGRVSDDGALQELHPGVALIALRSGAPVLPVALIGSDRLMPPDRIRIRHAGPPVVVRFGAPIPAEVLAGGRKGRAAVNHASGMIRDALAALLASDQAAENRKEIPYVIMKGKEL